MQQICADKRAIQIDTQGLCKSPQSHMIMISRDTHNICHPLVPVDASVKEKSSGFIESDVQILGLIFTFR